MKKSFWVGLVLFFVLSCIYAMPGKHNRHKQTKQITSVSMRHGGCFGKCPDYSVEVYKSGLVRYTGFHFTKDSGVYEKYYGRAAVKSLFMQLAEYRIDTCKPRYPNRIPDLSGLYYVIYYKNDTPQKINNAQFGPGFLRYGVTDAINNFANVDATWKNVTNTSPK